MSEPMAGRGQERAYPDAERIVVQRDGADVNLVVLAVTHLDGDDYALVTEERGNPDAWWLFAYRTDASGNASLEVIEDDERYEELVHLFVDWIEPEEEIEG